MKKIDKVTDLFLSGESNCAQAILAVYGEAVGMNPDEGRVLGRALGGGIGASGEICGFLTAAVLILAHALDDSDEKQARKGTQPEVARFLMAFRVKHGAVTCNELLGVVRGTKEGEQRIKGQSLIQRKCPTYGRDSAGILEKLLARSTHHQTIVSTRA